MGLGIQAPGWTAPWLSGLQTRSSPLRPTARSMRPAEGQFTFSPSRTCRPTPTADPQALPLSAHLALGFLEGEPGGPVPSAVPLTFLIRLLRCSLPLPGAQLCLTRRWCCGRAPRPRVPLGSSPLAAQTGKP